MSRRGGRAAAAWSILGFVVPEEGRGAARDLAVPSQARCVSQTARARNQKKIAPRLQNPRLSLVLPMLRSPSALVSRPRPLQSIPLSHYERRALDARRALARRGVCTAGLLSL